MDSKGLIDALGRATENRKRAEEDEAKAREGVISLELSDGTHKGKDYLLTVTTKSSRIIDTKEVYKALGVAKFLMVAKVTKKELVKYMLDTDIEKVSMEGKPVRAYTTSFVKGL